MKIDKEVQITLVIVVGLALTLIIMVGMGISASAHSFQTALKEGYSQAALPGSDGVFWVKDGKRLGSN
jgi:hypothetical protein